MPHIVILLFLYGASKGFGHRGLSTLLGAGIYLFIIYSGWYPIFAQWTIFWLVIAISISFFFFIMGKIFPPAKAETLSRMFDRMKNKKYVKAEIRRIEEEMRNPQLSDRERAILQQRLSNLKTQLAELSLT